MANITDFLKKLPEFARAPTTMLQSHLDSAAAEVDPVIFGDLADDTIYYLAAHRLTLSPYGQSAKLVDAKRGTTYEVHFKNLVRKACAGAWVP